MTGLLVLTEDVTVRSASQEISGIYHYCVHESPGPRVTFRFYGKELLAPPPSNQARGQPLAGYQQLLI
jgi:hypothetical protein